MKFPTPYFDILRQHFRTDPKGVHICSKGHMWGEPEAADTSAARMSEALCIAGGLLDNRAALDQLAQQGDGTDVMLGLYGYKADMCAHGMARGAADLAHFLVEHWGRPLILVQPEPDPQQAPEQLRQRCGVLAFLGVDGVKAESHIDLWDGAACLGKAYWNCRKAFFWKLE